MILMSVVGFNFTKIDVDKKSAARGKINIKNNISIKEVAETDLSFGTNTQSGLRFLFEYTSLYEPDIGQIMLIGEVLYLEESKKAKEIVKRWKKDKSLAPELIREIINTALTKCNIQALILSQYVNLPPPMPLPKVGVKPKEYIG
ncbi:MAG: hypothetical protein ABIG95_05885 [Candidatus Woesearchaeota archaeon]